MLTIPTELFLNILGYLEKDRENPRGAMAILNLAMTCRGFWNIIEFWASTKASQDLQTLSSLCSKHNSSPPSALSVLCRRLGDICMFCSNRARSSAGEVFTHLPICRACEARKVPKISNVNLDRLFIFSGDPEDLLKTLESRENLDHRLYRWSDIEPLVVNGYLKNKYNKRKPGNNAPIPFNPEEYAEFGFEQFYNRRTRLVGNESELPQDFPRRDYAILEQRSLRQIFTNTDRSRSIQRISLPFRLLLGAQTDTPRTGRGIRFSRSTLDRKRYVGSTPLATFCVSRNPTLFSLKSLRSTVSQRYGSRGIFRTPETMQIATSAD